jgi:hypothetical protein
MAQFRPFAITQNPGSPPIGTSVVGNIVIGVDNQNYDGLGGLDWYAGPDEVPGYIIAVYNTNNNQPTQFPVDNLYLDPNLKGSNITLSNSDTTAFQPFATIQSVLTLSPLDGPSIMFSVKCTSGTGLSYIGIGNDGTKTTNPLGNNTASIGFSSDGNFWYANAIQFAGLGTSSGTPTWVNGDIIDMAISPGSDMCWIRVNGGNWNNSPTANPEIGEGGLSLFGLCGDVYLPAYPGLSPAQSGVMTIESNSKYSVPNGFNFLGNKNASIKFLRCAKNDTAFLQLAQTLVEVIPATAANAAIALNDNEYWTSYGKSYWAFGLQ